MTQARHTSQNSFKLSQHIAQSLDKQYKQLGEAVQAVMSSDLG
jgi:hypothetical protein